MTTDKAAERRRREPWREYRKLDRRLKDWADWVHRSIPEHIGWCVYNGDTASGLRVQFRNDTYSDPVSREVEALDDDERRHWRTNLAVASLPEVWRAIIWLLYVSRRRPSNSEIADQTGADRRAIPDHILHALASLDRDIYGAGFTGLDNLRKRGAQSDSIGELTPPNHNSIGARTL